MSTKDHTEKQFNVRLSDEERAILTAERHRLGLRHDGDVIRLWIGAVRERRRAIERETRAEETTQHGTERQQRHPREHPALADA